MTNPQLEEALDEYLRVGINHYLVEKHFIRNEGFNTDVQTARRKVIDLYHPNGPGTPGCRFEHLMMELEKLLPDPEPFSAKAPEGRYLEEIRKLKLELEIERNNARHWKAMYYDEYQVELDLRGRLMTMEGRDDPSRLSGISSSEPCSDGAIGRHAPLPVANRDSGTSTPSLLHLVEDLEQALDDWHLVDGAATPEREQASLRVNAAKDAILSFHQPTPRSRAEAEGEALDPRTEYERFIVGWVAQHAPEVSERAGAAYREVALRPTPRSRAEAEAMLREYAAAQRACVTISNVSPLPQLQERADRLHAALLAALTGEGT